MAITFDHAANLINLSAPHNSALLVQDLINAIRLEEASERGIQYGKIADAAGKDDLGGGVSVGITVNLVAPWQLKYPDGNYQGVISGGNVVGGLAGNPIAFSVGVQVKQIQSAAGVIATVAGGSGLDAAQDQKLTEVHRAAYNRRRWDKTGKVVVLYDDDGVTPAHTFDTNDDLSEINPQ